MGASASVPARLTKEESMELCGADDWPGDAAFDELASEEGFITGEQALGHPVYEQLKMRGEHKLQQSQEDGGAKPAGRGVKRQYAKDDFSLEDMKDDQVNTMVNLMRGSPMLAKANVEGHLVDQAMDESQKAAIRAERHTLIHAEAMAAMAAFEKLTEEERKLATNDGDMEHYTPANQAKRESFFEDDPDINKILDAWWNEARTYFDKDQNVTLTSLEYAEFHRRLLPILADEGVEVNEDEAMAAQLADFIDDSGGDGSVDREEFRYSVFQLADQWTMSIEKDEYVRFMNKAFEMVYRDLIDADRLQLPAIWAAEIKGVKVLSPLPATRCVDIISVIIAEKIQEDQKTKEGGKNKSVADYTLRHFSNKHGSGNGFRKQFKGFCLALLAIVDNHDDPFNEFVTLFAQLAGVEKPSGKIKAMPEEAADFILGHMKACQPILKATKKLLPHGKIFEDAHEKAMTNKKADAVVAGYMDALAAKRLFHKTLIKPPLELNAKTSSLYSAAMIGFDSISIMIDEAGTTHAGHATGQEYLEKKNDAHKTRPFVSLMRFMVLLGVIHTSRHTTKRRRESVVLGRSFDVNASEIDLSTIRDKVLHTPPTTVDE